MEQITNSKYRSLFDNNSRYIILMGGRSAGRSYVASQYVSSHLFHRGYFRCALMRFILGDVRNSIFQEVVDRLEETNVKEKVHISDLEITYKETFVKGLGFRKSSGDQKSKMKSLANYSHIVIEEADEVSEEDFRQLDDSIRTLKTDIKIILLLNPPNKDHWIIKKWFNLLPSGIEGFYKPELKKDITNTTYIHTTFLDNLPNINQTTLDNFREYKIKKPDHYYSMIEGLVSEGARGRIFKDWKIISDDEYDKLEYTPYFGLDFGFSLDPSALSEIKQHNNKIYIKELIHETGLTNQRIAERMLELGVSKDLPIYADSAEPKSIEEIRLKGFNITGAEKGQDSINVGIDLLLDLEVHYTQSSINLDKEVQNYCWALDKNKNPINKPIDKFNHQIDSIRYGVYTNKVKMNNQVNIRFL